MIKIYIVGRPLATQENYSFCRVKISGKNLVKTYRETSTPKRKATISCLEALDENYTKFKLVKDLGAMTKCFKVTNILETPKQAHFHVSLTENPIGKFCVRIRNGKTSGNCLFPQPMKNEGSCQTCS